MQTPSSESPEAVEAYEAKTRPFLRNRRVLLLALIAGYLLAGAVLFVLITSNTGGAD